jgi:hypothetical protein
MYPATRLSPLLDDNPGALPQHEVHACGRLPAYTDIALLGMGHPDGSCIVQHHGVDFILCAYCDIGERQDGTDGGPEGARVMPQLRPEIQIEHNSGPGLPGNLHRAEGGAPARLLAQVRASKLEDAAPGDRSGQNIIDRQPG